MTNKQYSNPQLLVIGDAINTTLWIGGNLRRDNPWFRRYWLGWLPRF